MTEQDKQLLLGRLHAAQGSSYDIFQVDRETIDVLTKIVENYPVDTNPEILERAKRIATRIQSRGDNFDPSDVNSALTINEDATALADCFLALSEKP